MPPKKVLNFAFPSSREGLTNYVTRVGQDLDCSCEAKLYRPRDVCSHIFDVRLGESALPETKPEIDVLLGILKGLDIFVLSQNRQESSIFIPKQDVKGIDRAVIIPSDNPQEAVIEEIKREGYKTIGIFFDPIVSNRETLERIKKGYTENLDKYLFRSVLNNIACLKDDNSYGVVNVDNLENVLSHDSKKVSPASLIKKVIKELKLVKDYKTLKEASIDYTKIALEKMTKAYWYTTQAQEAKRDIAEHAKRRKTEIPDFKEGGVEYIFTVRGDFVHRNIAKGLFLRNFLQGCYGQMSKEIPATVYHLPTHHLEKTYEGITGQKMKAVTLFSSR